MPVRVGVFAGLVVTLCTDGWLMTGVSLTDEYWLHGCSIDEMVTRFCCSMSASRSASSNAVSRSR